MSLIGSRSRTFFELVDLLRAVEADMDSMDLVGDLNRAILKAVMRNERDIMRLKSRIRILHAGMRTDRPTKERSRLLKRRIRVLRNRAERLTRQLWLWKLFGDSLAHLYLDKFAIKHAFYETDSYDVKPDAGMIYGKAGLANEVGLLLEALKNGVPALLCDITNVIRYGDVCLLGASDPYIIEVKSSDRLNQRGKRQAANLGKLQDFLDNDVATNFRGNPGEVRRHSVGTKEVVYVDELNHSIAIAAKVGGRIFSPERGLNYVVAYGSAGAINANEFTSEEGFTEFCDWNDAKNALAWMYYAPFLLTIRDPRHLLDFIEGRLVIQIYANMSVLAEHMTARGWKSIVLTQGNYITSCQHGPTKGVMGVSRQMIYRGFYECTSLEWLAHSSVEIMDDSFAAAQEQHGPMLVVDQREIAEKNFGIQYDELMEQFDQM